jgi:hypothetical protein
MNSTIMKKRCDVLLIALVGKDLAPKWWDSRNKAFDDKTPSEQWEIDPQSVYDYLMFYVYK